MNGMPLEERLAIQDLASLYSLCCDTHEFSRMADLFTQDCVYDESCVGVERVEDNADLLRVFGLVSEQLGPVMHVCANHLITQFDGMSARGICYVRAEGNFSDALGGGRLRTAGYYDDVYEKQGGRWYFKERVLNCLIPPLGAKLIGKIAYEAHKKHLCALQGCGM